MDYNVTCPDNRYCRVRHRFASPCELWDCNACWWHHKNCTKTEEPATDNCPYVTCEDLPRPSHNHTVATISVLSLVAFGVFFFFFLRRRLRARRLALAANGEADAEADRAADTEGEDEHIPLLQRCRAFFQSANSSQVLDRFRSLVWGGERAEVAGPELLDAELGQIEHESEAEADPHRPSAPPPSYDELQQEEVASAPIVRNIPRRSPRGLLNQNYGSMEERVCGSPRNRREGERMEEIPLLHSRPQASERASPRRTVRTVPRSSAEKVPLTHSQSLT